jgi:hypothetical protein
MMVIIGKRSEYMADDLRKAEGDVPQLSITTYDDLVAQLTALHATKDARVHRARAHELIPHARHAPHPGDPGRVVADRSQMRDIHRGDDVKPGMQDVGDVLQRCRA